MIACAGMVASAIRRVLVAKRDSVAGLATILVAARAKAGMSQVQASAASTVPRTMISQFEIGAKTPTLATLYKLAAAYGVNVCVLLPGGELPKSPKGKK